MPNPTGTQKTLTEGPVGKTIFSMALPISIGLLATMSFNLADSYFVSGLGPTSLAALSFSFPVVLIALAIAVGLGAGTSTCVAISLGQKNKEKIMAYATDGFLLSILISAIFGIIGWLTIEPFFLLMGASKAVLPEIEQYMRVWYSSAVFMISPMVGLAIIRALGDTKTQGKIMVFIAALNIILDPILIYGLLGIPAFGIKGAAFASLIARLVSFVFTIYVLHSRCKLLLPICVPRFLSSSREIFRISAPAITANLIIPLSLYFMIKMISLYGDEAVAGYGVASKIEAFLLIAFYALSSVIGPFCGQNVGAKQYERIIIVQKIILKCCFWLGLSIALLLAISGHYIASIFTDNVITISVIRSYFWIVPLSYASYGLVMIFSSAFQGIAKPIPSAVLSSLRGVFIFFPIAFILDHLFQLQGIFVALSLSNILCSVISYVWLKRVVVGVKHLSN